MTFDKGVERRKAAERLKEMQPEYGAYGIGEIGAAVMGGGFTTAELRDRLIMLMEDGGWLDSAAERKCAELTAENAGLEMRGRMLQRALDEKEDELDRVLRERDEGWMRLPLDSDGEPIRVGDVIESDCEMPSRVTGMECVWSVADEPGWNLYWGNVMRYGSEDTDWGVFSDRPSTYRHAKPRSLEDVLRELVDDALDGTGRDPLLKDWNALVGRYADEIRKLTEVGR